MSYGILNLAIPQYSSGS